MADKTLEAFLWAHRMQHPAYWVDCGFFDPDGKFIPRARYPMEDIIVARKAWVEDLSNEYDAARLLMTWADGSSHHLATWHKRDTGGWGRDRSGFKMEVSIDKGVNTVTYDDPVYGTKATRFFSKQSDLWQFIEELKTLIDKKP